MKSRTSLPPTPARLPDPTNVDMSSPDAVRGFLVSLTSSLVGQLNQRPAAGTAQAARVFTSPDGKNWAVSVADDGSFVAEPIGSTQNLPMPPT